MHKAVDFFKNMPHFKNWTKSALTKLTYFFKKKDYLRNQIVFREGDYCNYVYIVFNGEFEITRRKQTYNNNSN